MFLDRNLFPAASGSPLNEFSLLSTKQGTKLMMRFFLTAFLSLAVASTPSAVIAQETRLFATDELTGWVEEQHNFFKKKRPNVTSWSVKDGVVSCDGSVGNCGFLRYDKKLSDFTLTLEFRFKKGCNSGVCFRNRVPYDGRPDETLPSRTGFELQILDDAGKEPSKTSTGSFYGLLAPRVNAARPAGEWNTLEIACHGSKIRVTLNGQLVQDVDQDTVDEIKNRPRAGYVSLQNHGHSAEFRNLRLREVLPTP